MAHINCNAEMTAYHRGEVALSLNQQQHMRARRNTGRTRLENGLDTAGKPQPRNVRSQGSYQMRLMGKRGLKALLPVGDRLSTIPRSSAPAMVCIKLGNAHHGQASRKGAASAPRAQRGVQERAGRTQP